QFTNKGVPLSLMEVLGDLKPGGFECAGDFGLSAVYDAARYEDALLRHETGHEGREGDYDVGDDVREDYVVARAQLGAQGGVGQDVAGVHLVDALPDAVELRVRRGGFGALGVHVAAGAVGAAEHQGAYAQD